MCTIRYQLAQLEDKSDIRGQKRTELPVVNPRSRATVQNTTAYVLVTKVTIAPGVGESLVSIYSGCWVFPYVYRAIFNNQLLDVA